MAAVGRGGPAAWRRATEEISGRLGSQGGSWTRDINHVERRNLGETPHPIRGVISHVYSQYGLCYKETILVNPSTWKAYQLYRESYDQLYIS
jgi:hypothetical protein